MGPKAKPAEPKSMEELQSEMNEKLNDLMDEIKSMANTIRTVKEKNEALEHKVACQEEVIADLKNQLNDKELYARSWSVRFLNIKPPAGKETDNRSVMDALYNQLLHPILLGAQAKGDITTIPSCDTLLEIAHILPSKWPNKPVIARFHSRFWKGLIFKHRKEFAPREEHPASTNTRSQARATTRMRYPFYEHLTSTTFRQLKEIQHHQDVHSAWTVGGVIKFRSKNSDTIYKVSSIFDTVDSILSE
jgi:hypothetical protein